MLRMGLRGYQLGHGNFNVFNADEIACRRNLRERAFTDWKAVTLFLLRGVTLGPSSPGQSSRCELDNAVGAAADPCTNAKQSYYSSSGNAVFRKANRFPTSSSLRMGHSWPSSRVWRYIFGPCSHSASANVTRV